MKTWNMSILPLCLVGVFAFSGGKEVGNGGDGYVADDGKIYLLDLVEAGVEENPYLSEEIEILPFILERTKAALQLVSKAPIELVARKISHIYQCDQIMAFNLLHALEAYSWKATAGSLHDLSDEDSVLELDDSVVKGDRKERVLQLAIRREKSIHYSRKHWNDSLDDANRAVLIFHEIVYAMMPPELFKLSEESSVEVQSSYKAREIVGFLFSKELKIKGRDGLLGVANFLCAIQGTYSLVTMDTAYIKNEKFYLRDDRPRILSYSLNPDYVSVELGEDMSRAEIEDALLKLCDKKAEVERTYHDMLIFPKVRLLNVYSMPGFNAYKGSWGLPRRYFKAISFAGKISLIDVVGQELRDKFSLGDRINYLECKKVSVEVVRSVWERVYGKPFPEFPKETKVELPKKNSKKK